MSTFQGRTVLITGGASGMGKLMGKRALEQGAAHLIVWDIQEPMLQQTLDEFAALPGQAHGYRVDVSDTAALITAAQHVLQDIGPVDILINNAGIVTGKLFQAHTHADISRSMDINASALMHLTLELLPAMIGRGTGHIVNIASAAGLVANPRMSVYCASKWAVIGWSDSLRLEMERLRTGVRVTTVTPFYINTGMFAGVRSVIPILEPEEAVRRILRGVQRNRVFVRMPGIIYLLPLVRGLLPLRAFDWFVGTVLGVYKTMNGFQGRG
ncbi:MAG: SDR family oxidoreductase [Bacteroidia bacterium]|nr:SDR family oxidoreductase [Bacteroidia bacterium]